MTREEAKRELRFAKREVMADSYIDKAYDMAIKALEQPEIIRCGECKHYQFADNRALGFPVKRCEWTGFEDVDDNDFCSRAERREEGDE